MPDTDKPLNGNGLTHIESSNSAALCALKYLASKYNKNFNKSSTDSSLETSIADTSLTSTSASNNKTESC
jgi:hypothetical protein